MHSVKYSKKFSLFVIKKFMEDDCFYRASALTFTTLLAIIPMMYVTLFLLSLTSYTHDLIAPVEAFILKNFIPSTSFLIQKYLQQFAEQANKLPGGDLLFLIVTIFFMMLTIEQAFNVIWKTKNARENLKAFFLYFAIILFGPIILGMGLVSSSFFFSLHIFDNAPIVPYYAFYFIPFLFSLLGLTFLYVIVPNAHVTLSSGFAGGIFATLTFEIAKKCFVFYISQFNGYTRIYGAFAVIPVFFFWVYLSWLIILIGAEISYACSRARL